MPLSVIHEGKVLDFHFKKMDQPWVYNFSIGDIFIGQIFKMRLRKQTYWSAVSFHTLSDLCPLSGFRTRYDAAEFLLKVCGFH